MLLHIYVKGVIYRNKTSPMQPQSSIIHKMKANTMMKRWCRHIAR